MKLDQELSEFSSNRDVVLTVGVFDGVHRGHCYLLSCLVDEARATGRLAGVVTFSNHPASVLQPDFKPRYLTCLQERLRLLGNTGVDLVVPITFDLELSRLQAREFASRLQHHLKMRGLVVGPEFAMGHGREGNVPKLMTLGHEMGFSVRVVELLNEGGKAVRSTSIREALARGEVARVAALLGRSFVLEGIVDKGAGRGRTLGFPTANLKVPPEMAIPGDGIYATWAHLDQRRYMAATSIGIRPTFGENDRAVEAFLLDFEGNIYNQKVGLEFVSRLRDELKYDTVQALQEQVNRDVAQTRVLLNKSRQPDAVAKKPG